MDFSAYQGYIFDLDGVLWLGQQPIPGAAKSVSALKKAGKRIRYLTNNTTVHRETYQQRLSGMGIEATIEEVVTSGYAAAKMLRDKYGPGKAYVLGTDELRREVCDEGHSLVQEQADFVIVGLTFDFTYHDLDQAFINISRHGSLFVACAENPTFIKSDGLHMGTGSYVKALAYALGKAPDLVSGKPCAPIMQLALSSIGLEASQCLMVGDTIDVDLMPAAAAGMHTLFVLSGSDKEEDLRRSAFSPTAVISSLAALTL